MTSRKMVIAKLVELANVLDSKGLVEEANVVDGIIQKAVQTEGINNLTVADSATIYAGFDKWMHNQIDYFLGSVRGKTVHDALQTKSTLNELFPLYLEILGLI